MVWGFGLVWNVHRAGSVPERTALDVDMVKIPKGCIYFIYMDLHNAFWISMDEKNTIMRL